MLRPFELSPAGDYDGNNLGLGMLIAIDEERTIEPIAVVSTLREAHEIAESNLASKLARLERDGDPGLCPYEYQLFAHVSDGTYQLVASVLVCAEVSNA